MIEPEQPLLVQRDAPYPVLVQQPAQLQPVVAQLPAPPVMLRAAPLLPLVVSRDPGPGPLRLPDVRPMPVRHGFRGPAGAQGPKGDSGGASTIARPVGAIVQGLRVLRSVDGVIYPVDLSDESHAAQVIGLGLQSVTVIGSNVTVQLSGPVTDSSWAWEPGVVWCGADGALTQAPAAVGWLMVVGRVVDPTTVDVAIEPPIYRG